MKKIKNIIINFSLLIFTTAITIFIIVQFDKLLNLNLNFKFKSLVSEFIGKKEVETVFYIEDNRFGWRLNPNTKLNVKNSSGEFTLRTNSDGFIDREHDKVSSNYRIAFVGDSWVEAQQVFARARFSDMTESYVSLKTEYSQNLEILNFGVSSLGTAHEYGIIKHFVIEYSPNEIWLFFFSGNDLADNSPIHDYPPFGPRYIFKGEQLVNIRFGNILPPDYEAKLYRDNFGKYTSSYVHFSYEVQPYFYSNSKNYIMEDTLEKTLFTLKLIKSLVDSKGIKLRLVYIPYVVEVNEKNWKEFTQEAYKKLDKSVILDYNLGEKKIKAFASKLDIDFISLSPLIRENTSDLMYGDHFSGDGHRIVANYLAEYIINKKNIK